VQVEVSKEGDIVVVAVQGDLDVSTYPTSEPSLRSSSGRGKPVYVIDLTNAPYSRRNV